MVDFASSSLDFKSLISPLILKQNKTKVNLKMNKLATNVKIRRKLFVRRCYN